MKTRKTTRATFSEQSRTIDLQLPEGWTDITRKELPGVLAILASGAVASGADASFLLLQHFIGLRIVRREASSRYKVSVRARDSRSGRIRRVLFEVTPIRLAEILAPMEFFTDPGSVPVRMARWRGAAALDAQLHGVDFGTYIQIENLYQGYLSSGAPESLEALAGLLYPGLKKRRITPGFLYGVTLWVVQLKGLFARMWPNFFRPASGAASAPSMLDVMNSEIRALTGGDISKEQQILETDCWRALTELDFKAKEADEARRRLKNMN